MRTVIVPDFLSTIINEKIEAARQRAGIDPVGFASDKDAIYSQLLAFYDEFGNVPDFELQPAAPEKSA